MKYGSTVLAFLVFGASGLGGCGVQESPTAGTGGQSGPPASMPGPSGTGGMPASPPTTTGGTTGTPSPGTGGSGGSSPGGMMPAPTGGTGGSPAPTAGTGGSSPAPTADAGAPPPRDAAPMPPMMVFNGMPPFAGGTMPPKEKVVVFLHLGHSNMAGRTLVPMEMRPVFYDTDPRLWMYGMGNKWTLAKEPTAPDMLNTNMAAGPGMAILKTAMAAAPNSYIISIGRGQSASYGGNCWNFRKGGLYFSVIADPAKELKGKVTFGGLFTMLGINERNEARARNNGFLTCMIGLINDFRTELGEPDLPFLVGDYEREVKGSDLVVTAPGPMMIIQQLAMIPSMVQRSALIPTEMIPMNTDNIHFSMAGHKLWAERAFAIMKEKGWMSWATP